MNKQEQILSTEAVARDVADQDQRRDDWVQGEYGEREREFQKRNSAYLEKVGKEIRRKLQSQ